jgi:hypothetical protein
MLQGTALLPSGVLSKEAQVMLQLRAKQDTLELGEVDAVSNGSFSVFSKNIALAYQPWMDEGSLVLQLFFGNRADLARALSGWVSPIFAEFGVARTQAEIAAIPVGSVP